MRRTRCRKRRRISGREAFPPSVGLCAEDAPISQFARPMKRHCKEKAAAPGLRGSLPLNVGAKTAIRGRHCVSRKPLRHKKRRYGGPQRLLKNQIRKRARVYLPFLGAFLSAFLAFFAINSLLLTFQRFLLRQGKRTECPLAH